MTVKVPATCRLWTTIRQKQFYTRSDREVIEEIYEAFRDEINRLKAAYAIERGTPPSITINSTGHHHQTPSVVLFGEDFDEVNRTLTGILALRWLVNGEYDRFVTGQAENVVLTRESFAWLRQYYRSHLESDEDLFCLILSTVVNDLGKDSTIAEDYYEKTRRVISKANHDMILLEAAKEGLVPCLDYLDAEHRQDIMLGLELGSELNAGQLAQAENVPVNLESLLIMSGNERAFNLKFMEQILDVAGAAGHIRSDGAKNLCEPVFQAFKTVYEVSLSIIKQEYSLRQGYDQVLRKRGAMLEERGYKHLSVYNNEDRSLLRLLTMGRTATLSQATLIDTAFHNLDAEHKALLIEGLNIDGDGADETAVVPYYMPAMLAEAIRSTKDSPKQVAALTSLMRYLARVLKWTEAETEAEVEAEAENDTDADAETKTKTESESQFRTGISNKTSLNLTTIKDPQHSKTWPLTSDSQQRRSSSAGLSSLSGREGRVYERNMIKARDMINSDEFRQRPEIMDSLDPPEGHLLKRRRTCQTL